MFAAAQEVDKLQLLAVDGKVDEELVLSSVWGEGYESSTHYVRIYVSRLRAKIETDGEEPYFATEHGLGYRFGS